MPKATLINPQGQKVVVDSGSQQAQQYFGQGYKLYTAPTVNSGINSHTPMITGYKNGVAVQVPKGAYVPGVSLTPQKVNPGTFDITKDAKYQELLKKNEELLSSQKPMTDATAAGTAAGADAYSSSLNELVDTIKGSGALSSTFTPEQQAQNKTDLLAKQAQIRDLELQTTKAESAVDFNPNLLTSQVGMSKQQIEREAAFKSTAMSNEEANLLARVNLSSQEQQNIINGTATIASYQDKIQSHIDNAKKAVLDQAKILTTQAQANLASALDQLKGTTWNKLSQEQQNQLYTLAQQGGYPVSILQAGMDAVAKQITLDNNLKKEQANKITIAEKLNAANAGYNIDKNGNLVSVDAGIITDPTGNSYDISSYATDPNHEASVKSIMFNMGQFKTQADLQNYIDRIAPTSPVTSSMIVNSANKYGVSWETMTAIMQQDSSLGTKGKAVKTKNPGNVGNTDNGATRSFKTWQEGTDAVAEWLSKHRAMPSSANNDEIVQSYVSNLLNGTLISMTSVPANLKNKVSMAMANQGPSAYTPQAASRFTMAANRIVSNYIQLPAYQLVAGGQLYLGRIAAAMKTPGSVSDQDLLDSLTKLNTGGNAITDAQVKLITDGQSFFDTVSVANNKLNQGGVLSNKQRTDIQTIAQNIFKSYQDAYQPIYQQASSQLEEAGIPKAFWTIPDLNTFSNISAGLSTNSGASGGNSYVSNNGNTYYLPN